MSQNARIGLASVAAGPLFVLLAALADLYMRLPAPVVVDPRSVQLLLFLSVPALLVGTFVALPINTIGAAAMLALGSVFAPARTRTAWALAGAALGGVAVWLFEAEGQIGFALVATSAFCGWGCSASD